MRALYKSLIPGHKPIYISPDISPSAVLEVREGSGSADLLGARETLVNVTQNLIMDGLNDSYYHHSAFQAWARKSDGGSADLQSLSFFLSTYIYGDKEKFCVIGFL